MNDRVIEKVTDTGKEVSGYKLGTPAAKSDTYAAKKES